MKDLRLLQGRRLEDIVIVDNMVSSFAAQLDNGIYVPSFSGDIHDRELLPILQFLAHIAHVPDVRPHVTQFAGLTTLYAQYKQD